MGDERAHNLSRRIGVPTGRPAPSDRLLLLRERDERVEGSLAFQVHQLALQLSETGELQQAAEARAVDAEQRVTELEGELETAVSTSHVGSFKEGLAAGRNEMHGGLDAANDEIARLCARETAAEAERDALKGALERADTLLMAANGALGRAFAASRPIRDQAILESALHDVQARLAAVSDTTLTALAASVSKEEARDGD
jgi:hypothetical protein